MTQAATTSVGLGMPNLAFAMVPGHIDIQTQTELRDNLHAVTVDQVIAGLTRQPQAAVQEPEIGVREIVLAGSFTEVNEYFYEREWSDGLPFVPPTLERVESFLHFTDRDPADVLGILLPDSRAATVWSVAVNGVMAGCRPEYMPVLVALVVAAVEGGGAKIPRAGLQERDEVVERRLARLRAVVEDSQGEREEGLLDVADGTPAVEGD